MLLSELKDIVFNFLDNSSENLFCLSLNPSTMDNFSSLFNDDYIVVDLEKNDVKFSPIAPFMSILKSCNLSENEITPYTYSLQKESFLAYFKYGKTEFRKDIIIMEELYYEKKRCLKTVSDLFINQISKPVIILNAQNLKEESIKLLKSLNEDENYKNKFLLCFDFISYNIDVDSNSFFTEVTDSQNYLDFSNLDMVSESSKNENISATKELTDFETFHIFFRDCLNFLSLENAIVIAEDFLKNSINYMFSVPQTRKLYLQISLLYLYANRFDDAASLMNSILDEDVKDEIEDEVFFFMGQLLYAKSAFQDALKYVTMVRNKNSPWFDLASMIHYMIVQKNYSKRVEEEYFRVLSLLKDNYPNNYVYTSFVFPKSIKDDRKRIGHQLEIIEQSFKIAKELDNEFGLSVACHWKGIVLAVAGKNDEAFESYHEADRIRCAIGETPAIIKIKNGISYEYYLRGDYKNSYDIANSYINKLTEIKDYSEILCTLKNVSVALMFMGHYKQSHEINTHLVRICKLFDLKEFIFCPLNDILIQSALCYVLSGKITQAKLAYHNLIKSTLCVSDNFSCFLPFIKSLLLLEENKLEEAKKSVEETVFEIQIAMPTHSHQIPFIYFQFANFLYKKGYVEESEFYRTRGIELADQKNFVFYTEHLSKLPIEEYNTTLIECDPLNINLEQLEELANREQLLNTLHKRVRDSLFLNKLTDMAFSAKNREAYVGDVAQSIFEYMFCDSIYIAEKKDDEWNLIASIFKDDTIFPDATEWEKNIDMVPNFSEKFIKCGENSLFFNLSRYDFICGVKINLSPTRIYSLDDINVLSVALSTLSSQLTILNQNEHLMMISSMDQLSKLKNRRALQEKLSTESEMIRRYQGKHSAHFQTSVTFIDLDHFKYYNDTYGHEAGDVLISEFSALLKHIYRRVDFVSRFGGDEFVVLLPNTTDEEALRASDRLREGLERANYFIPALEKKLGIELDVPKDHYLNFSAGICSNFVVADKTDMNLVMQNADKALFAAKNSGRSRTVLWTEIC